MVVADLHAHTTVSDGRLTLSEVPDAARAGGVDVVALTDHDRYHPGLDRPVAVIDGITVVRGIELRVETDCGRVDVLGYGLRETDALAAECDRIQRDRMERGRKIIECVEAETGVDLGIDPAPGLGRPDIARAVDASDAPYDYGEAFDELIGSDCPCYVSRDVPSIETGIELLQDACEVVSLAHPFRYDDTAAALDLLGRYDFDAVERFYPYDRAEQPDPEPVERAVAEHDLLRTGGTDAHETTLGVAGLEREDWERLAERLSVAESVEERV
ncbi:MAG: PHP domain-containing protein [Halobaculum sp.]